MNEFPKKLPGTFWGITTFFNPAGYKNKYENYRRFRESNKIQGLKLLSIELAFDGRPFEVKQDDADMLIQLRTSGNNVLWQKERLLNIGLRNLPEDCDKIAWLDSDILFKNPHWIKETSEQLEKYIAVQPYSVAARMMKGIEDLTDVEILPYGLEEGRKFYGMAYGVSILGKEGLSIPMKHGFTGFAWAARKELFDGLGFYDRMILGGGDFWMSYAFFANFSIFEKMLPSGAFRKDFAGWANSIHGRIKGSVSHTPGLLLHLWHGTYENRSYGNRYDILTANSFDPRKDILIDENNIWQWFGGKTNLQEKVRKYFYDRNEEDSEGLEPRPQKCN